MSYFFLWHQNNTLGFNAQCVSNDCGGSFSSYDVHCTADATDDPRARARPRHRAKCESDDNARTKTSHGLNKYCNCPNYLLSTQHNGRMNQFCIYKLLQKISVSSHRAPFNDPKTKQKTYFSLFLQMIKTVDRTSNSLDNGIFLYMTH